MTKSEANFERPNVRAANASVIQALSFIRHSSFVIRHCSHVF